MDSKTLEKKVDSLILSGMTLKVAAKEFDNTVSSFIDAISDLDLDNIEISEELSMKAKKAEGLLEKLDIQSSW